MSAVEIVRAGPAMSDLLAAIHAACFDRPWDAASFATLLGDPTSVAFVASMDDPVGFVLARAVLDEAEILTFGVVPKGRHLGVARALLGHLLRYLAEAGVTAVFLEVAEDNNGAIALYGDFGFRQTARRANYYERSGANAAALCLKVSLNA